MSVVAAGVPTFASAMFATEAAEDDDDDDDGDGSGTVAAKCRSS